MCVLVAQTTVNLVVCILVSSVSNPKTRKMKELSLLLDPLNWYPLEEIVAICLVKHYSHHLRASKNRH